MKEITYALSSVALAATLSVAQANVPDALSVEWQGKPPCEKLFEDEQVRVLRCTFPPGAVHVCHAHPAYLSYVVSGGQGQIQDAKGVRRIDVKTGAFLDAQPVPWHEFTNVGDTTIQFVVVEKKYQAAQKADQSSCPKGTAAK
jgi:quercetin dioxygenase-like cupin family protein